MKASSFTFKGVNSFDKFGIRYQKVDKFLPPKRARKLEIPNRNGLYDFGSKSYNERIIKITIDIKDMTRADTREIAYWLSGKGKLYLGDEPDKYYMAECYFSPDLNDYPLGKLRVVDIEFTCEPFAYREYKSRELVQGVNELHYAGTAQAPCRIEIRNKSKTSTANKVIITTQRKRGI